MAIKISTSERRTIEQIREHYVIEKELGDRLRSADKSERRGLYSTVYNELYLRIPHHPQLIRKVSSKNRIKEVSYQISLLKRFLKPETKFLEVGAGDCRLAFEVAKFVARVFAVDVSEEITSRSICPNNFSLVISDGVNIPVPENSINVAYSHHLMEHLHPDDAFEQLRNIYKILTPGGVYVCITPNRISGPHDISKYFDDMASGLHLKEYTTTEMATLFKTIGFKRIQRIFVANNLVLALPLFPVRLTEGMLSILPHSLRAGLSDWLLVKILLGGLCIKLIAIK